MLVGDFMKVANGAAKEREKDMQHTDDRNSKVRNIVMGRRILSGVMILSIVLGLFFMAIGLTPVGGVCFIVALVCALTTVIEAVTGKHHG